MHKNRLTTAISKVWPDGHDEIVALAAHNGAFIICGEHSIVVYGKAEAPAEMALADTVAGVGCVDRDTVQYTGIMYQEIIQVFN